VAASAARCWRRSFDWCPSQLSIRIRFLILTYILSRIGLFHIKKWTEFSCSRVNLSLSFASGMQLAREVLPAALELPPVKDSLWHWFSHGDCGGVLWRRDITKRKEHCGVCTNRLESIRMFLSLWMVSFWKVKNRRSLLCSKRGRASIRGRDDYSLQQPRKWTHVCEISASVTDDFLNCWLTVRQSPATVLLMTRMAQVGRSIVCA
jgi:hypothetical protein